ncbi:MAG: hypothetical protein ACLQDV_17050 [Candidatus Binataceae bacterium]
MKEADQGSYMLRGLDADSGDVRVTVQIQRKSYNEKRLSFRVLIGSNQRISADQDLEVLAPIYVTDTWKQFLIPRADPVSAFDAEIRTQTRIDENVSPLTVLYPDARRDIVHHQREEMFGIAAHCGTGMRRRLVFPAHLDASQVKVRLSAKP